MGNQTRNSDFAPDSGRLVHLRTPRTTQTIRIDAGFVAGDEISSFYDPMISKLIVKGPTRASAIESLRSALEDYEVVGPITNIEFLKNICVNEAFRAGHLDTNFIAKHREELFKKAHTPDEVYAQAALGLLIQETAERSRNDMFGTPGVVVGFGPGYQDRQLSFVDQGADTAVDNPATTVQIRQVGPEVYNISVNGSEYHAVRGHMDPLSNILTGFYPHTRLETTIINDTGRVTLFQRGRQYRIQCSTTGWMQKALGIKDAATSVLAPMPCRVLRVEVEAGDVVKKDQPLVVIESMKMEIVVRSPQDGVISKVVHQRGVCPHPQFLVAPGADSEAKDLCKAGTALVEFEKTDLE